jgi:hypothetical protein
VNHRRGQRWQTDLVIRIAIDPLATPLQARLWDLSHHGALVHLHPGVAKPGKTIAVWLPKMDEPIRVLVIHRRGGTLGLLWIEHSPWVDHTLMCVVGQTLQLRDERRFAQVNPTYAANPAADAGLPWALPCRSTQSAEAM